MSVISISSFVNTFTIFVIVLITGVLYQRFQEKHRKTEFEEEQQMIQQYLHNHQSSSKQFVWIYLETEKNTRNWPSFSSRLTHKLNQPYLQKTIDSIIQASNNSGFEVCIIHDNSLPYILTDWNIDMNYVPEPQRERLRIYAQLQILHRYGGLFVPPSLLCIDNNFNWLTQLSHYKNNNLVFGIEPSRSIYASNVKDVFMPSYNLIYSPYKYHPVLNHIIQEMSILLSKDSSNQPECLETIRNIISKNCITCSPETLGYFTKDNKLISLDDMMKTTDIEWSEHTKAIFIPQKDLLERSKYYWFNRMSIQQIQNSMISISQFF